MVFLTFGKHSCYGKRQQWGPQRSLAKLAFLVQVRGIQAGPSPQKIQSFTEDIYQWMLENSAWSSAQSDISGHT